jgi:hypothetical protein
LNTQKQPLNNLTAMKKIMTVVFLLLAIHATAQTDAVSDTMAKPAITGFGKNDGDKTEMKIGKDGGSISSSDGVVTLIFPEDALAKKTNISIQPVENMAPNGNGKGYKMEPSGIQFNKNATIVFNYANEDTANNGQALMNIAMQDENGKWFKLNKTVKDTVAKTITGSIKHFSTYVNFSKAKITPAYARLKVDRSIRLKIIEAYYDDTEEDVITLTPINGVTEYPVMNWKVNGIEKGNSTVGFISASTKGSAIFKAPEKVPVPALVAVSVSQVYNSAFVKRYGYNFMVSNILIYDNAYKVTMVHSLKGAAGSQLGAANYMDTGSFIVSITGKEATVIEKENRNTTSSLDFKGRCTIQQLQPGSGTIHILGVSSIRLIPPATQAGNPWVEIFFKRAPPIAPLIQITCPHLNGKGTYTDTNAEARTFMASMMPAFPIQVKFELKEEEQTILLLGKEGGESFVKFTVKKLSDD